MVLLLEHQFINIDQLEALAVTTRPSDMVHLVCSTKMERLTLGSVNSNHLIVLFLITLDFPRTLSKITLTMSFVSN